MSKHHVILKSKTLDIPIIITSSISEENHYRENSSSDEQFPYKINQKYKLDKGYSLDSHHFKNQNCLSSSSIGQQVCSVSNSVSSSEASLPNQLNGFQSQSQKYLQPPPMINLSTLANSNINADFSIENYQEPEPRM